MQKNIHPHYGKVIFKDINTGDEIATRSTLANANSNEVRTVMVETSSFSHPVYTGAKGAAAKGGQIDKFIKRYGAK